MNAGYNVDTPPRPVSTGTPRPVPMHGGRMANRTQREFSHWVVQKHDERLSHWLSAPHDVLLAGRVSFVFAYGKGRLVDYAGELRLFIIKVFEHIIDLTNELNTFDGTSTLIARPRSVCEAYADRKMQKTQITGRLKYILDLRNAAQRSIADTLEASQNIWLFLCANVRQNPLKTA
ncbi:hypothetical protein DFH08DRAFT_967639 [Mycena albidolilacea]|uniref:Uncharacterized protein n=1 Tax=Mycena albidolilacea TaxID=1033008 RepID=A0AAD6ZKN9_9AGAR|nr:hypothetical protein DFH08DRAFT_967639 [Mycena albidolilacea]